MKLAKLGPMILLAVFGLLAWQSNVPAAATPASCTGVWVVVDPGDLGGEPTVSCAAAFSNGTEALESAGFTISRLNTILCQIDSKPSGCEVKGSAYWSYWQAAPNGDRYSTWVYAIKGADVYHPAAGAAEGWRFGNGSVGPSVFPATLAKTGVTSQSNTPTQGEIQPTVDTAGDPTGMIIGGVLLVLIAGGVVIWKLRGCNA